MGGDTQLLSARSVRWIDVGVAVWIVVWVVVGVLVWHDIGAQAQLARDVIKVGTAVTDTGEALGVVGGLPLVGGQIGEFRRPHRERWARRSQRSGQDSRDAASAASPWSRGWRAAILPAAMVLFLYLPVRRALAAGRRGDRGGAAGRRRRPGASSSTWRAAPSDALPWDAAAGAQRRPVAGTSAAATYRALADAELARLGLRRPLAGMPASAGPARGRGSYFTVSRLVPSGVCAALPLRSRASTVKR